MNVFLIGFMGAGKTRVGKELANRLGYGFVDMDSLIEQQEGMLVQEIFKRKGEAGFRRMERRALENLVKKDRLVISTGGGVPCEEGNMDLINQHGVSVYLRMNPADLHGRLKTRQAMRPLIKDLSEPDLLKFIKTTLAERESYYLKAKFTVDGSKRDVDEILALVKD